MVYRKKKNLNKKYKNKSKFSRYKRKVRNGPTFLTLKEATVFPDRYNVKLIYSDDVQMSAGITDYYIYRGAGAFDPDYIAAGRYCKGWTELDNIYNRYICHASKIECKFISTGAGTNLATSGLCVVIPLQAPQPPTTVAKNYMDEPYAKWKIVGGAGGTSIKFINHYMTYNKINGKNLKSRMEDDDLANSLVTSYPANDWYWHIYVSSIDESSTLNQIYVYIKITYYLTFYERKDLFAATEDDAANEAP